MAQATGGWFWQEVGVEVAVAAPAAAVWARLTDAAGFPAWNSTVISVEGPIALGQRLALRVHAQPDRTFTPTVTELSATRMVWADGLFPMFRGVRTFEVRPEGAGCRFVMVERFEGLMLPLIRRSLPDFVPIFDRYAADLQAACERA